MLHQKLMQIPGTNMGDTHMTIMDIMAILMPITGQEGREDLLNQSQLPMLTLRLTLTTTIEDYGYYGHPYRYGGYLWRRKRRSAEPDAEPAADAEADPYLLYGGYYGLGHYGLGYGHYGYGYPYGYAYWG